MSGDTATALGMIDRFLHSGPASCTPQSQLSNFLEAGITTVVGVLGTDCITRRQARQSTSSGRHVALNKPIYTSCDSPHVS